jgi:hypothetical protein
LKKPCNINLPAGLFVKTWNVSFKPLHATNFKQKQNKIFVELKISAVYNMIFGHFLNVYKCIKV